MSRVVAYDGPEAIVAGVPAGCRAVRVMQVTERDGRTVEVRDRRGRSRVNEVVLISALTGPPAGDPPSGLTDGRTFWPTIQRLHGTEAAAVATRAVRDRWAEVTCRVANSRLAEPRWWEPTTAALELLAGRAAQNTPTADQWTDRAAAAAAAAPALAELLSRHRPGTMAYRVVVAAVEDFTSGRSHPSPRAFLQAHFADTKAVPDPAKILAAAGMSDQSIDDLGLGRDQRIGLGGPFRLDGPDGRFDVAAFGVSLVPARRALESSLTVLAADRLVVVENLQAAESVNAARPELPIIYTAGVPGAAALEVIGKTAAQVAAAGGRVAVAVDADLGGVRIASRIAGAVAAAGADFDVVDCGSAGHDPRPGFNAPTLRHLGELASGQSPLPPTIRAFAAAVHQRGYPVEQELAVTDAVLAWRP